VLDPVLQGVDQLVQAVFGAGQRGQGVAEAGEKNVCTNERVFATPYRS
jgi:hypothetical protein